MVLQPALDPSRDEPLYRQLRSYICRIIESGELQAGERLPATRELAGMLGVNRTTVSAAYELLEAEGFISGQVGRGSFVKARTESPVIDWDRLICSRDRLSHRFGSGAPISFAASRPPEEQFPIEDFRRSAREVLDGDGLKSVLQLGNAAGYEPLRSYLVAEAKREGVFGAEDDLLVTNGCQQALDLLARVLVRTGTRVGVEDPVYPGLKNILQAAGAELIPMPYAEGKFDLDAWTGARAAFAVVTPSFQNPTGLSLALEERQSLLERARASRDRPY